MGKWFDTNFRMAHKQLACAKRVGNVLIIERTMDQKNNLDLILPLSSKCLLKQGA